MNLIKHINHSCINRINILKLWYGIINIQYSWTNTKINELTLSALAYMIYKNSHADHVVNPTAYYAMVLSKLTLERRLAVIIKNESIELTKITKSIISKDLKHYIVSLFHVASVPGGLTVEYALARLKTTLSEGGGIYDFFIYSGLNKSEIFLFYMYAELMLKTLASSKNTDQLFLGINDILKIYQCLIYLEKQ